MKAHRSDSQSRLIARGNSEETADSTSRPTFCFSESSRRSVVALLRAVGGLTLAALLILVLWVALTRSGRTTPSSSWRTALFLAEKGAKQAIVDLQRMEDESPSLGEAGSAGKRRGPARDRTFIYSNVSAAGGATGSCCVTVSEDGPLGLFIRSTGIVDDAYGNSAQRTVHVTARRRPLFRSAVFAGKGLFVAEGAEIQSCGSGSGRTDNTLSCGWMTQHLPEEERLPVLLPPWGLPRRKAVTLTGGDVLTMSDSGVFPTITLLGSSRLIIDNDVALHIAGPLTLRGESRMVIRGGVRAVSMYIDKDMMVEEGAAIVNLTESALSLLIVGMERGTRITLGSREPLYASVYAPDSAIQIGPGAYLCGGLCGDTVHLSDSSRVEYDERLASLPTALGSFEVVSCIER